jgi:hypothetical protein
MNATRLCVIIGILALCFVIFCTVGWIVRLFIGKRPKPPLRSYRDSSSGGGAS